MTTWWNNQGAGPGAFQAGNPQYQTQYPTTAAGASGNAGGAASPYLGYAGVPQAAASEYQPIGGQYSAVAAVPPPQNAANNGVCAPACGGAPCGVNDNDPGVMTFVGNGAGEYITETSYRFVGHGSGEFTLLKARRNLLAPALCLVVVLIVSGLVAFFAWPGPVPTTTMRSIIKPVVPLATCQMWGDPHILSFDKSRPSFYGEGEFWIVKSPTVQVQGRYMGTQFTHGLAATDKIVVGGPFLGGHRITVGPLAGGDIRVDDVPVCQTVDSQYDVFGLATVRYNDIGNLVDPAQSDFPKRIVHLELPQAVTLTIFRWHNYLDMELTLPSGTKVDGSCGNNNGDPSDDTTEKIFQRVGPRVGPHENLFNHRAVVELTPEMEVMLDKDCGRELLLQADEECRDLLDPSMQSAANLHSCMYDVCFGRREHAQRIAITHVDKEAANIDVKEEDEHEEKVIMEEVDEEAAVEHAAEEQTAQAEAPAFVAEG